MKNDKKPCHRQNGTQKKRDKKQQKNVRKKKRKLQEAGLIVFLQ